MGCPCKKQNADAKRYANIKDLAQRYGRSTGKTVVIYRVIGGYSFMDASCPEAQAVNAVEYLYPL